MEIELLSKEIQVYKALYVTTSTLRKVLFSLYHVFKLFKTFIIVKLESVKQRAYNFFS